MVVSLARGYLTRGKEIIVVVIGICIIFCSTRLYRVDPLSLNTSASLVCIIGMILINAVLLRLQRHRRQPLPNRSASCRLH